jgi:hypothetical protein
VSKTSAAKKARRKKRVASRDHRWMPAEVHADLKAATEIDALLSRRGWEYDEEFSTDEFLTWFYPPSAVEVDDESIEPVTRVFITDAQVPQVILAGSTSDDEVYQFSVEELAAALVEVESYRAGQPRPAAF